MTGTVPAVASALDRDLPALCALVRREIGLKDAPTRIAYRLLRAWPMLALLGITDSATLLAGLGRDASLWDVVTPFLTVKETYFRREPNQLQEFVEEFVPGLGELARRRGAETIDVLSAGCATGEEAYSLAVILGDVQASARVCGIDIDRGALSVAERAVYGEQAFRGVHAAWRERHFDVAGEELWQLKDHHRARTRFVAANLLKLDQCHQLGMYDAIFCRNVLIYFETSVQRQVLAGLARRLRPQGVLFLGHSEMLRDKDLGLRCVAGCRATVYRREELP